MKADTVSVERKVPKAAVAAAEAESAAPAEACCGSCHYFLARKIRYATAPQGICRFMPSTVVKEFSDWCGQHKREDS